MTEQAIRAKTDLLYKAYGELSGADCILTVGEFLAMRKTAVEELRMFRNETDAYARELPSPDKEVRNDTPAARREEVKEEEPKKVPVIQRGKEAKERPVNVTQIRQSRPEHKQEAKKEEAAPLSDFEILRRAGDPWN